MADRHRLLARGPALAAVTAMAVATAFAAPAIAGPAASLTPPRKRSPPFHGGRYRPPPGEPEIAAVIRGNGAAIQFCYRRALRRDKALADGRLALKLIIGMSGMVKHVRVEGAPPFRQLEPCLREIVQRWVFPSASEQYAAEVSLVFQAGELDAAKAQEVSVPRPCWLTVRSVPWSDLWLDGKATGMKTPVVNLKVPCGGHRLGFKRADLRIDHRELITLRPDRPLDRFYKLAADE
jgi:hypothetical protein